MTTETRKRRRNEEDAKDDEQGGGASSSAFVGLGELHAAILENVLNRLDVFDRARLIMALPRAACAPRKTALTSRSRDRVVGPMTRAVVTLHRSGVAFSAGVLRSLTALLHDQDPTRELLRSLLVPGGDEDLAPYDKLEDYMNEYDDDDDDNFFNDEETLRYKKRRLQDVVEEEKAERRRRYLVKLVEGLRRNEFNAQADAGSSLSVEEFDFVMTEWKFGSDDEHGADDGVVNMVNIVFGMFNWNNTTLLRHSTSNPRYAPHCVPAVLHHMKQGIDVASPFSLIPIEDFLLGKACVPEGRVPREWAMRGLLKAVLHTMKNIPSCEIKRTDGVATIGKWHDLLTHWPDNGEVQ